MAKDELNQDMRILTIETCTETSTLGLVQQGNVLGECAFPSRYTLAKKMLSRLDWLLDECELTKYDIDAVALSLGPGSFTGVRIGAAAAKTLALGLKIPLLGISTLEALAYPFRETRDMLLAPVINARRQQAYTALFRGEARGLHRVTDDMLLSAEPFIDTMRRHMTAHQQIICIGQVGGLPAAFRAWGESTPASVHSFVTPAALAALAVERLAHGEIDDPMTLSPVYLRAAAD